MRQRELEHVLYIFIIIGLVSLMVCLQILRLRITGDIGHDVHMDMDGALDYYDPVVQEDTEHALRQSPPVVEKEQLNSTDKNIPARRDILPQKIIKTKFNLDQNFVEEWVRENIRRRQVLNSGCDSNPDMLEGPLSEGASAHILVSQEANLVLCCVPQAGCTNWKAILMVLSGRAKRLEALTSGEIHRGQGLTPLTAYPSRQQEYILETFTKILYVRNPFDRVYSAYKSLFENVGGLKKRRSAHDFAEDILEYHRKPSSLEGLLTGKTRISWEELATYLAAKGVSGDDHFDTIHRICDPCKVQYDYVGKLETVQKDAVVMLRELNFESVVAYPSRDNVSYSSDAELIRAFSNLHPDVLTNLTRLFARDFTLFDYTTPNFSSVELR